MDYRHAYILKYRDDERQRTNSNDKRDIYCKKQLSMDYRYTYILKYRDDERQRTNSNDKRDIYCKNQFFALIHSYHINGLEMHLHSIYQDGGQSINSNK